MAASGHRQAAVNLGRRGGLFPVLEVDTAGGSALSSPQAVGMDNPADTPCEHHATGSEPGKDVRDEERGGTETNPV